MSVNYISMLTDTEQLPVHTDLETLDMYCEYLLNDSSKHINFANLTNLKEYIGRLDAKVFVSNDAKMARYEFITHYLEARIGRGIVSRKMCLRFVADNVEKRYWKFIERDILGSITPNTLRKKDIEFINDMIFAQLNVLFMHEFKKPILRLVEDLETNELGKDPADCANMIQLFQTLLNKLTKAQRRSKQDNRFNLTDKTHFKAIMSEAWDRLLSDSQYWQCGWQGLNDMLGGGFESSRIYNFIGSTGGFKSGLLLNIMKGVKLHNKGHVHKDPTKRPTILFISQENNIWETILRIFGVFGTTKNIRGFTPPEIMELLEQGGFCLVSDELDIDIEFRYYGNMDIGVSDIRGIVDELDNGGREVIGIIQDYIERLRPPNMNTDRRVQLNDVSNQLHDLAIDLDVFIVTGSQFNRNGVATIEDMRAKGKADIGRNVGSKDVSESFGMLKNFDVNIGIVIEYDSSEERFYLAFMKLKFRGDDTDRIGYFLQPFVGRNSKIQLMEDINAPTPVYRKSMLDELNSALSEDVDSIATMTRSRGILEPLTDDTDEVDITNFLDEYSTKVESSRAETSDLMIDDDGYAILIPLLPMGQSAISLS